MIVIATGSRNAEVNSSGAMTAIILDIAPLTDLKINQPTTSWNVAKIRTAFQQA